MLYPNLVSKVDLTGWKWYFGSMKVQLAVQICSVGLAV